MALSFCGKRLLLNKAFFTLSKRHGYIVLIPEIGDDLPEKNPLLQENGLPLFNNVTIENCVAAIGRQAFDFEQGIKNIEKFLQATQINEVDIYKDVLNPLEVLGSHLDTTWGLAKTLYFANSSLMPTKSYLNIHNCAKIVRPRKYLSLPIFKAVKESMKEKHNYSEEQVRHLQKFKLEGILNGLEIEGKNKSELELCVSALVKEQSEFKAKLDIATKSYQHRIENFELIKDFPVDLLKVMSLNSADYKRGPWIATLQPQVYLSFMEHCPDRQHRLNVWLAMVTRGSNIHQLNRTGMHVEEIRHYRRKQANLLGYETFADMSMETKMAGSVDNVRNILNVLLEKAKPAQEQELLKIYEYALQEGFKDSRLELWDLPYWRKKYLLSILKYQDEDFESYFPLPKVLDGLFKLCEELFNIKVKQNVEVVAWDKDVQFYDVFEADNGTPLGGFYLDPYIRKDEKLQMMHGNGLMIGMQNRSQITDTKPLAALIFNFQPPTVDRISFLTFKDVKALFHKFGIALQHIMTQTSYSDVSGLSNIDWDATEVCGHVLTHWLYNKSVIDTVSSHKDNGNTLPTDMFDTLVSYKQQTAGLDLCRELYLSALDLELHTSKDFWLPIIKNLWPKYRCFPLHKYDVHPCSFSQIFSEEWAAAYYSNIWSRVIAADVYSAFYEVRNDKQEVSLIGKRFKETFLFLGGSCKSNEVFRKFRGRDPSPKALLRSLGLKTDKNIARKLIE